MNRDNDKGKILIGRTLVWVGVQFAMLLLIIVRLYYLQVYQADKFSTMADENRISTRRRAGWLRQLCRFFRCPGC